MKNFSFHSGVCLAGRWQGRGPVLESLDPSTEKILGRLNGAAEEEVEEMIREAQAFFDVWRLRPAPRRGEVVRLCGEALRRHKEDLARLISREMGKIYSEALGEVQEAIDIADYALGLSRQLCGITTHSERPCHRLYEQWHPLGVLGIVTAFNFPVAVWAWNAFIAAVCGDVCIWKPSSHSPLCATALQEILLPVLQSQDCPALFQLAAGSGSVVGQKLVNDKRIALLSFTGSVPRGRKVAGDVASRLGRFLLELGGNNAVIVSDKARLDLALRGVLFGAVGTAGQRCTSTRRLFLQEKIADEFLRRLKKAYGQVLIGDPLDEDTLMGPLIHREAVEDYQKALKRAEEQGGEILAGGRVLEREGFFVSPTLVAIDPAADIVQEETFAPILYVSSYGDLAEAIARQNAVPQGLSSSLFSDDFRETELFLSVNGSDCGIANINTGSSGAEIGLAFGGEKDTGGGRESGSDAWKNYMRRQSNALNFSRDLPLAQGVSFGEKA
jgi:aldehyde dehydrogenase (NAD+)